MVVTQSVQGKAQPIIGDVNGDGLPDVVLKTNQQCWPLLAGADGTFRAGSTFYCPPMMANQIYLADATGDGVDDMIGFYDHFESCRQYISVCTGLISPELDMVASISDGTGARYRVDYRSLSEFGDELLPFAIAPVERLTVDDGLGTVSETGFFYSGALYDYVNRSFAGFGRSMKTMPDGSIVETWFHQDEYRRGLARKIDHREPGSAGGLLTRTAVEWNTLQLTSGPAPGMFVYPEKKRLEFHDGDIVFIEDRYEYDSEAGNLTVHETSGTDAEKITRNYDYRNHSDWLWRKASEALVDSTGDVVRKRDYEYEAGSGNLLWTEDWLNSGDNPVFKYDYDSYGNRIAVTDPRGFTTYTAYDDTSHIYPVQRTDALGRKTSFNYDERFGRITSLIDQNGNETQYDYDPFGRLVVTSHPDGGRQWFEFDDFSMPRVKLTRTAENTAGGTLDKYEYFDGLGRGIQTVSFGENGKKITTRRYYDAMGRADLTEGPFYSISSDLKWPMAPPGKFRWKQVSFDFRGRPTAVEAADGDHGSVVTTYQYAGFSTVTVDPDGCTKTEQKDYLGRTIKVVEHTVQGDFVTRYSYNAEGDLLKVIDHYGNTTLIGWDSLGRKTMLDDPDMGIWHYAYDPNGNVISQTDAKQQTINFSYDALNRLAGKKFSTGDPAVFYEYDNAAVPNGIGRLYSVSNSTVTTTNDAYDEMGRILKVSKTISGSPQAFVSQVSYDLSGRQVSMTYPDGYVVTNTFYPGSNLLEKVTGEDGTEFAHLAGYQPGGKIGRIDHGNGTYTTHSYDPESARISSIVTGRLGPAATLQEKHYRYTKAGDIARITDNVDGAVFDYTYDKLHRLTGEAGNKYDPIAYRYDAIGNITSKTVGSTTMVYSYGSDHPHAVKRITLNGTAYDYSYDANGNMTAGPDFSDPGNVATRKFTYNAVNMPLSVTRENAAGSIANQFNYDGNNTRAVKQSNSGGKTFYISESAELIDGVLHNYVFAGNLRVAKIAGGELSFYHKDHLGSSSVVTDEYGGLISSISYRPFGSARNRGNDPPPKYGYTDQEHDAEIGLYNYNARLFDQILGKFIQADFIVPNTNNPKDLNRYAYCRNNPIKYSDPSGHNPVGMAIGATAGAISGLLAGLQEGNATAAVFGGIVGGIVGALVGSVAPQSASPAATAVFGALSSICGGIAGRGTVASITSESDNSAMSVFAEAFSISDITIDALTGSFAGIAGGIAATATKGTTGSITAIELTTANISISSNLVVNTISSIISTQNESVFTEVSEEGAVPANNSESMENDGFNL